MEESSCRRVKAWCELVCMQYRSHRVRMTTIRAFCVDPSRMNRQSCTSSIEIEESLVLAEVLSTISLDFLAIQMKRVWLHPKRSTIKFELVLGDGNECGRLVCRPKPVK